MNPATPTEQPDTQQTLQSLTQQAHQLLTAKQTQANLLIELANQADDLIDGLTNPQDQLTAEIIRLGAYAHLAEQARQSGLQTVAAFRYAQVRGVASRVAPIDHPLANRIAITWQLLADLGEVHALDAPRGDLLAAVLTYLSQATEQASKATSELRWNAIRKLVLERTIALQLEQGNARAATALAEPLLAGGDDSPHTQQAIDLAARLDQPVPPVLIRALDRRAGAETERLQAVALVAWGQPLDPQIASELETLRDTRGLIPIEPRLVVVGGSQRPPLLPGWDGASSWIPADDAIRLTEAGITQLPAYIVVDESGRLAAAGHGPTTLRRARLLAAVIEAQTPPPPPLDLLNPPLNGDLGENRNLNLPLAD
ncbi:hypothetical protein [Mucisphaera sp.]|uniref:hypothetical protein n=1 Tax=Mucisphaera sp. TaxID=2913024 RepID=UPI003D0ECAF1